MFETGKLEGKKELETKIITNMYKNGMTIENISLITNISIEKIKNILAIE
ncbi:MAG: hypothetical protein U0354_01150 [Candidatus Sericytochromatia bacterium]